MAYGMSDPFHPVVCVCSVWGLCASVFSVVHVNIRLNRVYWLRLLRTTGMPGERSRRSWRIIHRQLCFLLHLQAIPRAQRYCSDNMVASLEGQLTLEPKLIWFVLSSFHVLQVMTQSRADFSLSCPGQCHWMWKQSFAQSGMSDILCCHAPGKKKKLDFCNMQDLREHALTPFVSFASMRDFMHVWHVRTWCNIRQHHLTQMNTWHSITQYNRMPFVTCGFYCAVRCGVHVSHVSMALVFCIAVSCDVMQRICAMRHATTTTDDQEEVDSDSQIMLLLINDRFIDWGSTI